MYTIKQKLNYPFPDINSHATNNTQKVTIRKNKKIGKPHKGRKTLKRNRMDWSRFEQIQYAQLLSNFTSKDLPIGQEFIEMTAYYLQKTARDVCIYHLKMVNEHRSHQGVIRFILNGRQGHHLNGLSREKRDDDISFANQEKSFDNTMWTESSMELYEDDWYECMCQIQDMNDLDCEEWSDYFQTDNMCEMQLDQCPAGCL